MTKTLPHISHDFETYSDIDISVGAWAYSQHPSTYVKCWSIKVEDDEPVVWLPGDPLPEQVEAANDFTWFAWNAFFEWCIWHNTLKLPPLPLENQMCTRALALALALPPSLGECGQVLGLPDHLVKNPRGKELIDLLCKPQIKSGRDKKTKLERELEKGHTIESLHQELYGYCGQDSIAEHSIKQLVRPLIPRERQLWQIDFEINIRGVPLDVDLLENAAYTYENIKEPMKAELIQLTGLKNPNSGPQFKGWLAEQGFPVDNLQKPTVKALLDEVNSHGLVSLAKIIEWRAALARTPLTKYAKTLEKLGNDGRFHGALDYHKATTGRWASTGVNFQNLSHSTFTPEEIETCVSALDLRDPEFFRAMYQDPIEALSSCIRGMIKATAGNRLIVADYKSIEARVAAWLADQMDKLQIFATHGKVYEHAAAQIFRVAIDEVTKSQRAAGKVSELACGYQGGYRALLGMAVSLGIDMAALAEEFGYTSAEAFARYIVRQWRAANKRIESMWYETDRAVLRAMQNPGEVFDVRGKYAFKRIKGMLLCRLPSGRQIAFFNPRLREGEYGLEVEYWAMDPEKHKWMRRKGYGGSFFQSVTQATARDILGHAIPNVEAAGYPIVLLVHDEVVAEVPIGHGSLGHMCKVLCDLPSWARGLPVAADGFEDVRYQEK